MSSAAPPPSSRLSALARRVRSAPGYRRVTDSVLPGIRGNETVVDLLTRLVGEGGRLGGSSHPLVTTADVDVAGADRWPIVIVTLDDPDGSRPATVEEVEAVVAEIGRLQVRLRCFRAVFLVTGDALAPVRRAGHAVELLPDPADLGDEQAVRRHRARRVVSMTDHYRAWLVLDVPVSQGAGLTRSQRELLEALPAYLADQHDLHDLPTLPGVTDEGGTGRVPAS